MYTRFKNQKSGLKIGLNTISSNRKVVIPASNSLASSICSTLSTSSSSQSLNSTESQKNSGETSPLYSPTTSIINSVLTVSSVHIDDNNNLNEKVNLSPVDSALISFEFNDDGSNINVKSSFNHSKKEKHSQNDKTIDEPIDLTCISYVKSTWEKYSNEIGQQNGPLKHVDENEQYPHLNGFVAFDMEHWWAERSISSMINQKEFIKSSETNTKESVEDLQTNNVILNDTDFLLSTALKKSAFKITNPPKTNKKLIVTQLHSLNNFNLCFS